MADNDNKNSVTVALRRNKNSLEGKFLEYIKSEKTINLQKFLDAAMAFYLPDYLLEFGDGSKQDKMRVIDAIGTLEAQIIKIKRLHNLESLSQVHLVTAGTISGEITHVAPISTTPTLTPKKEIDSDSDEDDFFDDDEDDPISAAIARANFQFDAGFRIN